MRIYDLLNKLERERDEARETVEALKATALSRLISLSAAREELAEARGQRDRLAEALKGIAGMPEYDQDDPYRLRNKAAKALQSLTTNEISNQ